ncbi:hypothetical protein ACIQM4_01755 [Streptomyces sp. NPDC091272]|uniref:hypothetical protein n=1 Tax=Streptomyces sp. NPDC091272 TaxID=3365981 RepID=UPI003826EC92
MSAYETQGARLDALHALHESTDENRAERIEAAWRTGTRNATELASLAGISRAAVHEVLRERGIDRNDSDAAPAPRPDTLTAEAAEKVARPAGEIIAPFVDDTADPGPLTTVAWQLAGAYRSIAALLIEDLPDADRLETAEELSDFLQIALHHSHLHRASRSTPRELTAQLRRSDSEITFLRPMPTAATVTLALPSGESADVRLEVHEEDRRITLSSESPGLDAELEAHELLELHVALDMVAQVLTRHL